MAGLSSLPLPASLDIPPDPDQMNDKRSAAAERALLSFSADFGELIEGEDMTEQNLADLLADFAHLCDRKGLHLAELIDKASRYYEDETDREGRQFQTPPLVFSPREDKPVLALPRETKPRRARKAQKRLS